MSSLTLNDGIKIPALGFGCGSALFGKDCSDDVKLAIDSGFIHLDGAQAYGNEEALAKGIKAAGRPREELFIVTKLLPGLFPDQVRPTLEASLKKLGVDFVDLFLIHCPIPMKPELPNLAELWKAMEAIHDLGLAKSIGVSNFRVEHLKAIQPFRIAPSVNQIELHPYVWKAVEPIVTYGREIGNITPASYGGLTPLVRAAGGPLDQVLPAIAERLSKEFGKTVTLGQVVAKWILQKGAIVISTSSKQERLKEYLETPQVPDLTDAEVKAIEDAGAQLHKRVYMKHVFVGE
ncbi:oxidoreductase [Mycena amicta]|nr:oxidoreductase [Mycena amicta]